MKLDREDKIKLVKHFFTLHNETNLAIFLGKRNFYILYVLLIINNFYFIFERESPDFLILFVMISVMLLNYSVYSFITILSYFADINKYNYGINKKTNNKWVKINSPAKNHKQLYVDELKGFDKLYLPFFINWDKYNNGKKRDKIINSLL